MAGDFTFHGQSLDNRLVASISSLLDSVHVPNLLWGNYLLTIYGIPTVVDGVAFIVPDDSVNLSYCVLSKAGFLSCTRNTECPHGNSPYLPSPISHLHLDDELVILLYQNSNVLSDLPYFVDASQNRELGTMSASDNRLPLASLGYGQGRLVPQFSSIRIPTAVKYCEALIFLLCRDHGCAHEMYWMAMLTYMLEYVDGTDILHEEDIGEKYRTVYHAMKSGDPGMFSMLDELRRELFTKQLPILREH